MKNIAALAIASILLISGCSSEHPSEAYTVTILKDTRNSASAESSDVFKASRADPAKADSTKATATKMCGWLISGPMADWYLRDKNGEWTLEDPAAEGATTTSPADGIDLVYNFKGRAKDGADYDSNWISTSEGMDYTCGCLEAETDKAKKRVTKITKAEARPVSDCTLDKDLPAPPH